MCNSVEWGRELNARNRSRVEHCNVPTVYTRYTTILVFLLNKLRRCWSRLKTLILTPWTRLAYTQCNVFSTKVIIVLPDHLVDCKNHVGSKTSNSWLRLMDERARRAISSFLVIAKNNVRLRVSVWQNSFNEFCTQIFFRRKISVGQIKTAQF